MNLYVVRHGQTDWNINHMILGKTDIELNEKGKKQAEEVSKKLEKEKIDLIISSPLKRTKQTAEIINKNKNIPIIYDSRIQERNFGEFEGLKDIIQNLIFKNFGIMKKIRNMNKQKMYKIFLRE